LKIEKRLKERSGRYALCSLPFCACVNRRESAVKTLCGLGVKHFVEVDLSNILSVRI